MLDVTVMSNSIQEQTPHPQEPDPLKSYLDYYKKLDQPGYAVLVTGDWGVGKTYQVERALEGGDYIYVSLFGLQTAEEVYLDVLSKADRGAANRIKLKSAAIGKSAGGSILGFGLNLPVGDFLAALVDGNARRKIDSSKIIVFDDLERSTIDLQAKLGIINFYVEQSGCSVIVIAHDDKITTGFNESKEKIFGQTIRVLPKTDEAFGFFVSTFIDPKKTEILNAQAKTLKKLFAIAECKSLRVLKQLLNDILRFYELFEPTQIQNSTKFEPLLELFIAFDIGVRSGNLNRDEIKHRQSAHISSIAESMNRRSTGADKIEAAAPNRFLKCRKRFESVLDLNSTILSDDLLIQMIVDGQYDKTSVQEFLSSNFYFVEQSQQPAWHKFMNLDTNENKVVEDAAREMDEQFNNRNCHDLGEFLHIVSLKFMRSQNKLLTDGFEKITADAKSYLDDLVKLGNFPTKIHKDNFRDYGGSVFWVDESYKEFFDEVRSYIRGCNAKAIELKMPALRQELLELLKRDPEKFIAALGISDGGTGEYYALPVLSGIGANEFVDHYLEVPLKHWHDVDYFLNERMRRSEYVLELLSEKKWFADLVAEMKVRVAAMGNTIAAFRLKRYIPTGKNS